MWYELILIGKDTGNALELCLSELDSCRPFFIGMLGNRYGWVPESYVASGTQFDWLRNEPPGKSITHLEMQFGALNCSAKAAFYFRDDVLRSDLSFLTQ